MPLEGEKLGEKLSGARCWAILLALNLFSSIISLNFFWGFPKRNFLPKLGKFNSHTLENVAKVNFKASTLYKFSLMFVLSLVYLE